MYRQYKYLPEVNKPCCRATRSREYQAHIDALHRIKTHKGLIDNSHPNTPQTIGRNYKRYEHEQQRNLQIRKDNMRLIGKMDKISREEHYPRAPLQRPYTLQGSRQKEEMVRITRENHKLLNAVQERKPILNRNDWRMHKLDHQYQLHKMSEYKPTVPMSEIIRQEFRTSQGFDGESYASSTRKSQTGNSSRKPYDQSSKGELQEEIDDRTNTLLGDGGEEDQQSKGELEEHADDRAGALLGDPAPSSPPPEEEKKDDSKGDLEEHVDDRANALLGGGDGDSKGKLEEHLDDRANALLGGGDGDSKGKLEDHVDDRANALLA